MSTLITGCNGFLGRSLVAALDPAEEVVGIDIGPKAASSRLRYIQMDITDPTAVAGLFREHAFSTVYHFAALTEHAQIVDRKNTTLAVNLRGTMNLLEAFEAGGGERFLYTSTGKVYGPMTGPGLCEDSPTTPGNVLGKTKLITEDVIRFFAGGSAGRYVICRIFNIYGPGQKPTFVVPAILTQLRASRRLRLGELRHKRDYIYIADVVRALLALASAPLDAGASVFNIGSGVPRSVADILAELECLLGFSIEVEVDAVRFRSDEFGEEYADTSRLRALGWQPGQDFRQGLHKTVAFYAPELLP